MALISCPKCERSISDKASSCPHCGNSGAYSQTPHYTPPPMEYMTVATAATPALIIFLIDVSASMMQPLAGAGGKSKLALVQEAYYASLKELMSRSTKGEIVSPRYAIQLFTYSHSWEDVYGGTISIGDALKRPIPEFRVGTVTNTYAAFEKAYEVLKGKESHLKTCPAPMVCHLTDGEYSDRDPRPIVEKIRQIRNNDGSVLVENIFVGEQLLTTPIRDAQQWPGVQNRQELANDYAKNLYDLSSPLPASYAIQLYKLGYSLEAGVKMLIPAINIDLVELAFAVPGATNT